MKILAVVGARPNFVKIAPLMAEMRRHPELHPLLVHTGQHYDQALSTLFFEELAIAEPDLRLAVGSGSHATQTAQAMVELERAAAQLAPDLILVVGDVNSTLAAALVAAKACIPLAHVEAGLRSGDRTMPEEVNRVVTDALSDLLFTTEAAAAENLAREGVPPTKIHFAGNVMVDTLLRFLPRARALCPPERVGLQREGYAVVTLHRPSNVDRPEVLQGILHALAEIGTRLDVVFPVHPRTRAQLEEVAAGMPLGVSRLRLTEPLGYLEFLGLVDGARLVLTDSGGLQEETTALGVPCLTLRENTERPATIELGTNRLVGTDPAAILPAVSEVLEQPPRPPVEDVCRPPLWDGHAAERIVKTLRRLAAAACILGLLAGAGRARAQTPGDSAAPPPPPPAQRTAMPALAPAPRASPLVPPDHWSWDAARRLDVLGLLPGGFDRGRSLRTRRELAWLFDEAAARAEEQGSRFVGVARAYRDRFREEFGNVLRGDEAALAAGPAAPMTAAAPASPPDAAAPPAAAPAAERAERAGDARGGIFALSAGYARMVGRVATGVGYLDWSGTHPIPDTSAAFLAPELALGAGAHLSLHGEPLLRSNGVGLKDADLVAVLGPIGAWAGRRTVRFGPGEWGGIVLGDRVPLDGFGGFLAEPIHFPWLLRAMGPIQIESFFSKTYGGDTIRDPFFVAFRGTMSPAARLTIGLNRAAMFAGRGNEPITLRNMAFLFIGGTGRHGTANTGSFANDVLSADVSWRPPLERWLPLVTYLEWGMDDGSGMWHRAPGIVAGVRNDAVPGLPWLSLGIERTSFPVSGKINTMWYRDWSLRNGWADAGVPIGHPLGGEGTELLGTVGATLLDARLRLSAHGYRRHRGNQNLFAPERMGVSHGGSLRLEGRLGPELDLLLDGEAERGAGGAWSTSRLSSALRWMH